MLPNLKITLDDHQQFRYEAISREIDKTSLEQCREMLKQQVKQNIVLRNNITILTKHIAAGDLGLNTEENNGGI